MGLSGTGQGMREGTGRLRHTSMYEDGRMLLSHHEESLGREGWHLTEFTNAMGAAFTDTVTRKIMLGSSSLFPFLFP